jgi:[ribosomal protein S18]-alanine N-acetyltransferase
VSVRRPAELHPGLRRGHRAVVHIQPMRRRDLRSVLRIDAQQDHEGWSVGLYLAELKRTGDRRYVVARAGGHVVGFAGIVYQDDDAHVTTIAVDRAAHGQRIATRLLLALVREAIARGAQNLTLEVRAGNAAAIALYRRFGLAPAGIRKNYYADIGEDALIMWAHDLHTPVYAQRLRDIAALFDQPTIVEGLDS